MGSSGLVCKPGKALHAAATENFSLRRTIRHPLTAFFQPTPRSALVSTLVLPPLAAAGRQGQPQQALLLSAAMP